MQAGAGIGRAGPARYHADARGARELPISVGHHRRTAFMAASDHSDRTGIMQRIQHGEIAFSRYAKHMIHMVDFQLIDQDLSTGPEHWISHFSFLYSCLVLIPRFAPESSPRLSPVLK